MYPVKYDAFNRYAESFLTISEKDFSDNMVDLKNLLNTMFGFAGIDLNSALLAYAINFHNYNAEFDVNNVVYHIVEVANDLRKDGILK